MELEGHRVPVPEGEQVMKFEEEDDVSPPLVKGGQAKSGSDVAEVACWTFGVGVALMCVLVIISLL